MVIEMKRGVSGSDMDFLDRGGDGDTDEGGSGSGESM